MIRMLSLGRPLAAFVACSLVPALAHAQSVPGTATGRSPSPPQAGASVPGLDPSGLQTVHLVDRAGAETSGKLLVFCAESVRLLVDGGERRFELEDVARIERRDSLRNGAIIGASVGLVLGLVTAGISDCPGDDPGGSCAGFRALALVMTTGVHTALGIGIDALIPGRTTLYRAPPTASRTLVAPRGPAAVLRAGLSW